MPISNNPEYDKIISGSFTANAQTLDITSSNIGTVSVQITGTWVGTIVLEVSNDGTNWVQKTLTNSNSLASASNITDNGIYICDTNGIANARLRVTAWTSGTASISSYGSDAASIHILEKQGQNTMAQSVPVVIASDQSTLNVAVTSSVEVEVKNDSGNPIPVNGTVAATQSGTWTVQPGNTANTTPWLTTINQGGNSATVTAANALKVDGSAVTQPISAASLPLPTGAATSANQTTEITSLQLIDDLPHAQNATLNKGVPVMGQLDDTSTTAATEDAVAVARITAQRAIHTNLRNNSGTEIATATNPLRVDPTGTTIQPVSGTITANQGAPNTPTNAWFEKITDGTDTVKVTTNSDLSVSDGLRNGGVYGAVTLTTANTAYEAKVGVARLSNRKSLTITALDDMFWGYDSSVTTSTGTPLYKNQQIFFSIDPDSTFQVWLVASANTKSARITEAP